MESKISGVVVVAGVALFAGLLCAKQIGQTSYVVLMSGLALVGIVLYGFNRIREVDLKNLKVSLDKIEQMRDEIYARADTLKKLSEEIAEIATVLATDRIPQLIERGANMLETRYEREVVRFAVKKRVVSILLASGDDQIRIKAMECLFDEKIRKNLRTILFAWLHSHANTVLSNRRQDIQKEFAALREKGSKQNDPEYQDLVKRAQETDKECTKLMDVISRECLEKVFRDSPSGLPSLEQYLKGKGIWSMEIECHLNRFGEFISKYPIAMNPHEQLSA